MGFKNKAKALPTNIIPSYTLPIHHACLENKTIGIAISIIYKRQKTLKSIGAKRPSWVISSIC